MAIKINPRTQIRWEGDIVPSGIDIPSTSLPKHADSHAYFGTDPVTLDQSQIIGLGDELSRIHGILSGQDSATISGVWTFTQPLNLLGGATISELWTDVVTFVPIARPDTAVVGTVYHEQSDNKLYLQTPTGMRAFVMGNLAPPLTLAGFGQAGVAIGGYPHLIYAQAKGAIVLDQPRASGQSNTYIGLIKKGSGQARVLSIGGVSLFKHSGQANAQIAVFHINPAQAQAWLNLHIRSGQAKTRIIAPYPNLKFGLSNTKLKVLGVKRIGQSRAWIGLPPGGPWSVPFLSRTSSGQIHLQGVSNSIITGKQFVNIGDDAIIIEGCNNITITENDFSGDVGAIYLLNSTNITITWNRYLNIGDGTIGSGHSNFIQFNNSFGGYIAHNKGKSGNTEDIVSIFASGGTSTSNRLIIEYNAFQGTDWSSGSGSGFMLGDAGGHNIVARYNTILSPGQVGFGVPSGTDIHITDNTIYGEQRTNSNVGIYVWNQYPTSCSDVEIARNQVKWYRADGVENPYWDAGNCGTVNEYSNNWSAPIDPSSLIVTL